MTLATFLVFLISAVAPAAQPVLQPAVVFVCEHGAAKSVIATASTTTQNPPGKTTTIDFENDALNGAPRGFAFANTAGRGAPGRWIVVADRGGKALAQTDADRTNDRFPMAVVNDVMARDLDLSVRFRPVSGKVDQAAGLVWRYQDENNYYLVRANALEGNVVLYKVEKGRRTDLPIKGEGRTYGKKVPVPSGEWSQLSVSAKGNAFQVQLNGKLLYEVDDATFTGAGKVGVWTKADSVTHFDDLTVTVR
jgi:hypothetical protein